MVQVDGRSGTLRPGVHAGGVAGDQGIADCLRDLVAVDGWRIGQHHRLEGDGRIAPAQPVPDGLRRDGAEAIDSTYGPRVRAAQGGVGEVHVQPDPRGATTAVTLPTWRVGGRRQVAIPLRVWLTILVSGFRRVLGLVADEELEGMRRTSENPDGLGAANINGVRVALVAEEVGDPIDRGHERQDVQARAAGDQGADVMVVGPPHCHEPSGGRVLLGGPGAVGVGLLDGGVQDCLEPGPPQRGDHLVHHGVDLGRLGGGQGAGGGGNPPRLPRRHHRPWEPSSRAGAAGPGGPAHRRSDAGRRRRWSPGPRPARPDSRPAPAASPRHPSAPRPGQPADADAPRCRRPAPADFPRGADPPSPERPATARRPRPGGRADWPPRRPTPQVGLPGDQSNIPTNLD